MNTSDLYATYNSVPEPIVNSLLLKLAKNKRLSKREQKLLALWRSESTANGNLAARFSDPKWVAQQLAQMDELPANEIWKLVAKDFERGPAQRPRTFKRQIFGPVRNRVFLVLIIILALLLLLISIL